MKRVSINNRSIIISVAIIALFVAMLISEFFTSPSRELPEGSFYAQYIDVGQGDSSLIITPNGKFILIDTGTPDSKDDLSAHLDAAGVKTIDYLILTHPHADHIGGAAEVIENFQVKKVLCPDIYSNTRTYEKVLEAIDKNGCEAIIATPGDKFELDSCSINIFGPITIDQDNLNNDSIVCSITYGDTAFMFTGDMEADYEKEMIEHYGRKLKSDVLKVGHHGSSTSSSEEFLSLCSPDIAVISCGKDNEYGHPHSKILKRLRAQEIDYYRTDEDGTVTLMSDGEKVTVYKD